MSYTTVETLKKKISEAELIQLTDDERLGAINEERVNTISVEIANLIEGFLRGRYPLPLNPVPAIIQSISDEKVIYKLFLRKKRQTITREMTDNDAAQTKLLEKMQKGEITLGVGETPTPEQGEGEYKTNKTSEDRVFSKSELEKY